MVTQIKIKKGLDLKLKGEAQQLVVEPDTSEVYGLIPDDFYGITPKLAVKEGDAVKVGTVVFFDKTNPELKVVSPVCGTIKAVNRGERRKIMSIEIAASNTTTSEVFDKTDLAVVSKEELKSILLKSGMFAFFKQRPYDIVANPSINPKAIFISCFDSAPLAQDIDFILKDKAMDFHAGVKALSKISDVFLGTKPQSSDFFKSTKDAQITEFSGPHPAGNVGVQIHHISPINKGEVVWTISPMDVAMIGKFLQTGVLDFSRKVAVVGSEVVNPIYVNTVYGAGISSIVKQNTNTQNSLRYINGNPLTGSKTSSDGFLSAFAHQITIIPEGDDVHEMFGWIAPRFNQFSVSRSYFSWIKDLFVKNPYALDARIKGGERHMIASGEYDRVFPMDIYPEFLLKAILAGDIDKMEALGIYEVAPEDFALCEFVCSSKVEVQKVVRQGLDLLYNEMN